MINTEKDRVYRWGEELTGFAPRIPGTSNMDLARDYILEKLNSFGIETSVEPINFKGVFHKEWEFRIISPEQRLITSYPENNVGFGDVEAELVDAGDGTEASYNNLDVSGKIVLVNWGNLARHELSCGLGKRYPLLETYDIAWSHGAAGMAGYFTDTPGDSLKLLEPGINPCGGSNIPGPAETGEDRAFLLPVLNIGKPDALYLKNLLKKSPTKVRMVVNGKRKVSTVWSIIGTLQGKTNSSIMVGSHYCTAFSGAICDTVGVVGALSIAERFSRLPVSKRPKTMHFLFSGTHVWLNCNIASLRFIHRHRDLIPDITAMLWMDHISGPSVSKEKKDGFQSRFALTSGNPVLYLLTLLAMIKNKRYPLALPLSRLWTFCEMGPFDSLGIPSMCMQAINHDLLTTEDTWEKIEPENLYHDIMIYHDLAKVIQKIPGRLLRKLEIPGRSFFGCGSLFKDISVPEYPEGETYEPETSPPLYEGSLK